MCISITVTESSVPGFPVGLNPHCLHGDALFPPPPCHIMRAGFRAAKSGEETCCDTHMISLMCNLKPIQMNTLAEIETNSDLGASLVAQ